MISDGSVELYCSMVNDNINQMESFWDNPTKKQRDYLDALKKSVDLAPIKLRGDFYLTKHNKVNEVEVKKTTKKKKVTRKTTKKTKKK